MLEELFHSYSAYKLKKKTKKRDLLADPGSGTDREN